MKAKSVLTLSNLYMLVLFLSVIASMSSEGPLADRGDPLLRPTLLTYVQRMVSEYKWLIVYSVPPYMLLVSWCLLKGKGEVW